MKDSLKKFLEGIASENTEILAKNSFGIKRIVLFNPKKIRGFVNAGSIREVLSYTENCFLNTQFKIDHQEIKVVVIPWYDPNKHYEGHHQEGDYAIDIGDYLSKSPEFS